MSHVYTAIILIIVLLLSNRCIATRHPVLIIGSSTRMFHACPNNDYTLFANVVVELLRKELATFQWSCGNNL